jgi:hypothetical protein
MSRGQCLLTMALSSVILFACSANSQKAKSVATTTNGEAKGKGKFADVQLTHPLDKSMVAMGQEVHSVKCSPCHKLTDEKLVGPGWKGVTNRRTPEWVMNFVTNTDEMIDNDPTAQALLDVCMVRMPNQHLTDNEARAAFEFMRSNDGKD